MQGAKTARIVCYLDTRKQGDRDILARLRADRLRRPVSATVRAALAAYYAPPTLPPPSPEVQALAGQLAALTEQMAAQLDALSTLAAELADVRAQNAALQTLLLSATFGDKAMRRAATEAAHALATGNGTAR